MSDLTDWETVDEAQTVINGLAGRIEQLERENANLTHKIALIKHKIDIDARKEVLLSVIGKSPQTSLAEVRAKQAEISYIEGFGDGHHYSVDNPDYNHSHAKQEAKQYAQQIRNGKDGE